MRAKFQILLTIWFCLSLTIFCSSGAIADPPPETFNPIDVTQPKFSTPGNGTYIDLTNFTDSSAGMNQAIIDACTNAKSVSKSIYIPYGIINLAEGVKVLPCNGLNISGPVGAYGFESNGTVTEYNAQLFDFINGSGEQGSDNVSFNGAIFQGISPDTNTTAMIRIVASASGIKFVNCTFQNSPSASAILLIAPPLPNGSVTNSPMSTTPPTANIGPTSPTTPPTRGTLYFFINPSNGDSLPSVGAYIYDHRINANTYVYSVSSVMPNSETVTLNAPLTDTIYQYKTPQQTSDYEYSFTRAVQISLTAGPVPINATQFTVAANAACNATPPGSVGACPGDALAYDGPCIATNTRVTSVGSSPYTTITFDKPLLCSIAAGTYISAAAGYPNLLISHSTFHDIGQSLATAATSTFVTSSTVSQSIPIPTMSPPTIYPLTLQCGSTFCKNAYAVIPGQIAASINSGSTVIGDPVLFGAENTLTAPTVNHAAGTVTVMLQATGSRTTSIPLPAGTPILFQVGETSGHGGGIGVQNAPWFANVDDRIEDSSFYRLYSGPIGFDASSNLQIVHTTIKEEHTEYQSTVIAPSGCMGFSSSIGLQLIDDVCSGATGVGVQINHPTNAEVLGGMYAHNSDSGIIACGAQGLVVGGGVQFIDNGEWVNYPLIQSSPTNVGLHVTPSCSSGQPGYQSNVQVTDAAFIDDRPNTTGGCPITDGTGYLDTQYGATQTYGIGTTVPLAAPNTILLGAGITFSGNTCGTIDPNIALATNVLAPPILNVQVFAGPSPPANWVAPAGCITTATATAVTRGTAVNCLVRVIAIGGGGGSGGGGYGATTVSGGAAGGSGACPGWPHGVTFLSNTLPASVPVLVGAAGTSGAGGSSGVAAVSGTAGGMSSFGSPLLVIASGGGGGAAGSSTASGGGAAGGLGQTGGTGTGATAGVGDISYGNVAGGSGAPGAPNPAAANASGAGAALTAATAAGGVGTPCDASGGAGGSIVGAAGYAGGEGGATTALPASGSSVALGGAAAVPFGASAVAGGRGFASPALAPATSSPGGGGAGGTTAGNGAAGGACAVSGYGASGGGGGAGKMQGGSGGASCGGYVAVVTTNA